MEAMAASNIASSRDWTSGEGVGSAHWRSLRYFGGYRVLVAAVFFVVFLATGGQANLASQDPTLFLWVNSSYVLASFAFLLLMQRLERAFNLQLSLQVICDVVALTILMYASGGARSGIAFMLVVVVAGAGLVGQGRLTLFYAALAALAVLAEQSLRFLRFDGTAEDFIRTGLTSIGFFATALIAQMLARRAVANEHLALQRGVELRDQIRINRQVIRDMEDGVLVIDAAGNIQLNNPRAAALLGLSDTTQAVPQVLKAQAPKVAEFLERQRLETSETSEVLRLPGSGPLLVRRLPPEQDGNILIYLRDVAKLHEHAQQVKLAALGRLTANIAHEIRNPLAAISHAAELLVEEQRADPRRRLVRIIGDNCGRLNRLVGDVLELGRRDLAQPEHIDLGAFLRQFIEEYAMHDSDAGRRIDLTIDGDVFISFDRLHLHRVMVNLVSNALRYASDVAGSVGIVARTTPPGVVELHVLDDGPGISEDDRAKIFEPFFTTRGSGTGLGLYIARELCASNGAEIELVRGQGESAGAHFRITARNKHVRQD